jgi:hypothetical protein
VTGPSEWRSCSRPVLCSCIGLVVATLALAGCKRFHRTDMRPLDQAGMWFNSVEQLRQLGVTDAEVLQLVPARQAGVTDQTCIELVRLAHNRHEAFADGPAIAGLIDAGLQEGSVLALTRLNQLGLWAGEAQAMRLAGLSDAVVLAVARRRAAGQPVLSGAKVAALQNAGLDENAIIAEIHRGTTDVQADQIIARRNYIAGGHSFVHQRGRRR